MDGDAEAELSLHKDLKGIQKWQQEKEEEEGEEDDGDDDDDEYGEETRGRGKGWLVVLSGFIINMLAAVGTNNFGILFSPRLLELGLSPGSVAGVANVALAASYLLCLPVAPLLHRWGCRHLLLLVGFVCSATFSLAALAFSSPGGFAAATIVAGSFRQVMAVVVQVAVSRCFDRRERPLAMGMALTGSSISQIVGPAVIAFTQSHYNPRTVLLMTSVLMLHICIAATLLPSDPDRSARRRVDYLAIVRRREVAILCLVMAINYSTLGVFWATVPMALLDTGHSSHEVGLYFSMVGVATLIFRVAISLLLCHFRQPITVMRLSSAVTAAIFPVWYWCERLVWRVAWLSLCGGSSSVVQGLAGLVVLEVVGLRWQAETLSLVNLAAGVASLPLGQLVDFVRVVTGSYASKMHAMSALLMLSQVLWESLEAQPRGTPSGISTTPAQPITEKKDPDRGVEKRI